MSSSKESPSNRGSRCPRLWATFDVEGRLVDCSEEVAAKWRKGRLVDRARHVRQYFEVDAEEGERFFNAWISAIRGTAAEAPARMVGFAEVRSVCRFTPDIDPASRQARQVRVTVTELAEPARPGPADEASLLRGALESMAAPVALVGDSARIDWANAGFRRLLAEIGGREQSEGLTAALRLKSGSEEAQALAANLRGGVAFEQLLRLGDERVGRGLSVKADPIEGSDGARFVVRFGERALLSPGMRESLGKLEEARKLFVEVAGANQQLERALDLAREEIERARRESAAKSAFLANMSHEIRTPMNAVIGFCDLLSNTKLDREQDEYVEAINQSGQLLIKLIGQVLDYSKIESGHLELEEEEVQLDLLLQEAQAIMGARLRAKDIAFRADYEQVTRETVVGDATRIKQVLINLLGNAFKFTREGEIRLKARTEESSLPGHVRLLGRVEDTGIGIDPDRLKSLFAPFSQAHEKLSRDFGGTGLGLAICKRLCQEMKGDVWVESTSRRRGTVFAFEIHLPLQRAAVAGGSATPEVAKAKAPSDAVDREASASLSDRSKGSEPLTLLVVDDNPNNLLITSKLSQHLGYRAETVASGVEALKRLKAKHYDIVLMDVRMAPINGIETTRRIRQGEAGKDCSGAYIIAVTAHALQGDREKCLESGMNDYLAKPLTLERLEETLARARNELSLD